MCEMTLFPLYCDGSYNTLCASQNPTKNDYVICTAHADDCQ